MPFDKSIQPFDEGVEITIPGHKLVVPELSFAQREANEAEIATLNDKSIDLKAKTATVIKLIRIGLSRHYPDVTEEDIRDTFTAGNLGKAIQAVVNVRGAKLGEARAAIGGQPTGTQSTDS